MKKNLVFLGAPGAGKGTQAAKICAKYRLPHISTGDILRANIKAGTPLGTEAKRFIDAGQLVPDEVVTELVRTRLADSDCADGFVLDGFPRTTAQSEALEQFARIDCAVDIRVDDALVIKRIAGRRMCACGESYHTDWYASDVCAKCGAKLYQRNDDREDTVRARLEVYYEQTAPLIEFYRSRGILEEVDGTQPMDAVTAAIERALA